jgi:hypothetical protein
MLLGASGLKLSGDCSSICSLHKYDSNDFVGHAIMFFLVLQILRMMKVVGWL